MQFCAILGRLHQQQGRKDKRSGNNKMVTHVIFSSGPKPNTKEKDVQLPRD